MGPLGFDTQSTLILNAIDNPFVSMYLSKKIDAELSVLDSTKKIFLRWLRHVM